MNYRKKAAFTTLGCKVNQYETESIKKTFLDKGYEIVEFDEAADVYVVNSCTVTSIADRKTRNMLRRAKKISPGSIVVATGCYAQTNSDEIKKIEDVDMIIGNAEKADIVSLVDSYSDENENIYVGAILGRKTYDEVDFATYREMSRAYLKIQDGCECFCSYCKIPFARGGKRSRPVKSIIDEAGKLAGEGYKEIVLIGINLGVYGDDLAENIDLEGIIEEISKINGIERIRLGSVYPDRITDKFIKTVSDNKKLMPHFHLSIQAGDDFILKLMKRKYKTSDILERMDEIRNVREDVAFTADFITGFPGESLECFENTIKFIVMGGFEDVHIFQYSEREGTLAAGFPDKVPQIEKKRRAEILEELRNEVRLQRLSERIGKIYNILIEEKKEAKASGYSENYLKTVIDGYSGEINKIIPVRVKAINKELLLVGEEEKN